MIGQMRDRVIFKSPIDTPQAGGGGISVYVFDFEVWCKAEIIDSKRVLENSQDQLMEDLRVTFRYSSNRVPNKSSVMEYNGYDYAVNSIIEVNERGRYCVVKGKGTGISIPVPLPT